MTIINFPSTGTGSTGANPDSVDIDFDVLGEENNPQVEDAPSDLDAGPSQGKRPVIVVDKEFSEVTAATMRALVVATIQCRRCSVSGRHWPESEKWTTGCSSRR